MRNTGNKRKIDTFKIKITISSRLKTFVVSKNNMIRSGTFRVIGP